MEHNQLKTEFEMMMKLALVVVRLDEDFIADDSQYTMPYKEGNTQVYDLAFLDIRFIESGLSFSARQKVNLLGSSILWLRRKRIIGRLLMVLSELQLQLE